MRFAYFVCAAKMSDGMGRGLVPWRIEIIHSIVLGGLHN